MVKVKDEGYLLYFLYISHQLEIQTKTHNHVFIIIVIDNFYYYHRLIYYWFYACNDLALLHALSRHEALLFLNRRIGEFLPYLNNTPELLSISVECTDKYNVSSARDKYCEHVLESLWTLNSLIDENDLVQLASEKSQNCKIRFWTVILKTQTVTLCSKLISNRMCLMLVASAA